MNGAGFLFRKIPVLTERQRRREDLPFIQDIQLRGHVLLTKQVHNMAFRHNKTILPLREEELDIFCIPVSTMTNHDRDIPKDSHGEDLACIVDVIKSQGRLILVVGGTHNHRVMIAGNEGFLLGKGACGDALGRGIKEQPFIFTDHLSMTGRMKRYQMILGIQTTAVEMTADVIQTVVLHLHLRIQGHVVTTDLLLRCSKDVHTFILFLKFKKFEIRSQKEQQRGR